MLPEQMMKKKIAELVHPTLVEIAISSFEAHTFTSRSVCSIWLKERVCQRSQDTLTREKNAVMYKLDYPRPDERSPKILPHGSHNRASVGVRSQAIVEFC